MALSVCKIIAALSPRANSSRDSWRRRDPRSKIRTRETRVYRSVRSLSSRRVVRLASSVFPSLYLSISLYLFHLPSAIRLIARSKLQLIHGFYTAKTSLRRCRREPTQQKRETSTSPFARREFRFTRIIGLSPMN